MGLVDEVKEMDAKFEQEAHGGAVCMVWRGLVALCGICYLPEQQLHNDPCSPCPGLACRSCHCKATDSLQPRHTFPRSLTFAIPLRALLADLAPC